jgi:hypothetical protein
MWSVFVIVHEDGYLLFKKGRFYLSIGLKLLDILVYIFRQLMMVYNIFTWWCESNMNSAETVLQILNFDPYPG